MSNLLKDAPKNCIRTYTGQYVNLLDPQPETIIIEDIAHSLSLINRWVGHTSYPYSVGSHSIFGTEIISQEHKLAFLFHDATEAYLGDVSSPLKQLLPNYIELEHNFQKIISHKFGFEYPFHTKVKAIDKFLLNLEWEALIIKVINESNNYIYHLRFEAEEVEIQFLQKYKELSNKQ